MRVTLPMSWSEKQSCFPSDKHTTHHRFSWWVDDSRACVRLCVYLCVSVCLYVFVSLYVCVSVSVSLCVRAAHFHTRTIPPPLRLCLCVQVLDRRDDPVTPLLNQVRASLSAFSRFNGHHLSKNAFSNCACPCAFCARLHPSLSLSLSLSLSPQMNCMCCGSGRTRRWCMSCWGSATTAWT